jgi:hypothetical protein
MECSTNCGKRGSAVSPCVGDTQPAWQCGRTAAKGRCCEHGPAGATHGERLATEGAGDPDRPLPFGAKMGYCDSGANRGGPAALSQAGDPRGVNGAS